jgi:hypothetical protein
MGSAETAPSPTFVCMRRHGGLLAAASVALAVLTGCADDETDSASGTSAATAVPTATATTDATSDPAGSADSDDQGAEDPTPSGDIDQQGPLDPGSPGFPVEAPPVHGAQRWAVYVAVGPPGDSALPPVLDEVRRSGWEGAGIGELSCDAGAAEALGRDPSDHAVAVYFETPEQVEAFARFYGKPYVGTAQVTTYCLD